MKGYQQHATEIGVRSVRIVETGNQTAARSEAGSTARHPPQPRLHAFCSETRRQPIACARSADLTMARPLPALAFVTGCL